MIIVESCSPSGLAAMQPTPEFNVVSRDSESLYAINA